MLDGFSVVYATIRTGSLQEGQLEAATTRCQLELAAANVRQNKQITKQNSKNVLNLGWIVWHSEGAKQELKNQAWMDPFDRPVNEKYA